MSMLHPSVYFITLKRSNENDTNNSSHHHHHWWKSFPKLHFTSTHTFTYRTPSTLFFLHFTLFLDAKRKKKQENRKTLKIDVVKRYVRDSLSHYLMLFLTWYFCFYLWYTIYVIFVLQKCNISWAARLWVGNAKALWLLALSRW